VIHSSTIYVIGPDGGIAKQLPFETEDTDIYQETIPKGIRRAHFTK